MIDRERELRRRLLAIFRVEATEYVASMTQQLVALEKDLKADGVRDIVESVFRQAHSLKGAARAVGMLEIERICQGLESVLSGVKRGEIDLTAELVDRLLGSVRKLEEMQGSIEKPPPAPTVQGPIAEEKSAPRQREEKSQSPSPTIERASPGEEVVRVATAKLDALRVQAEELVAEKIEAGQRAIELRALESTANEWRKRWNHVRLEVRMLQEGEEDFRGQKERDRSLSRIAEFLEWNRSCVESMGRQASDLSAAAERNQRALAGKIDELLEDSLELMMLPSSWLLEGLHPLVRDLARDLGKEVDLGIQGSAIDIDRRVLTELRDPFIHILRNCVDHGIEAPVQREAVGKPRRGNISVSVTQLRGNRALFRIADDGRGVDVAKLRASLERKGPVPNLAARSDEEVLSFILQSGVSTSPIITDVSGRGLGLAIVREKIERLGGTLTLHNSPGRGIAFEFAIPLSLASFRGVVVDAAGHSFAIPTASVERVILFPRQTIKTVEGRETAEVDGKAISVARLASALRLPEVERIDRKEAKLHAVIISAEGERMAILVDRVSHEQEVVVKSLGPHLQGIQGILGATTLITGVVAPILDATELIRAAVKCCESGASAIRHEEGATEQRQRRILVAEDSITSRTLLRNILEAAGYFVETAVDGVEALGKLRIGEFDLVVSDVDMPRLNGLGLTGKIRDDRKLANTPVVLVTSLDSREDRERGIEVGANAYIVKKSFEQSNLLEVVRQLL